MFLFIFLMAVLLLATLLAIVFFGGIALGVSEADETRDRMTSARLRALEAERRLHDLTRDTFIRMSEAAERRRSSGGH